MEETSKAIYLDFNASTPLLPSVVEEMVPMLSNSMGFGNPSCKHVFGSFVKEALKKARERVATMISCDPSEIIFTSGGTESNNMAIKGVVEEYSETKGNHVISLVIEHPSVTKTCLHLKKRGVIEWDECPVDRLGVVNIEELKKLIRKNTVLISVMHANNQVGSIQPLKEISKICKEKGILLHTDAAQSIGKVETNVDELGVDLMSICSHKFYGPKGVGALYIRKGVKVARQIHGAAHENNMRAGTENVVSLVGFGKACELAGLEVHARKKKFEKLWKMLYKGIVEGLEKDTALLNGPPAERNDLRIANTLSMSFPNVKANLILKEFENVLAVSAGAACCGNETKISYVLSAMCIPKKTAMGAIRFSIGAITTEEEIRKVIDIVCKTIKKLKSKQN